MTPPEFQSETEILAGEIYRNSNWVPNVFFNIIDKAFNISEFISYKFG
jgi:hypothetical protein